MQNNTKKKIIVSLAASFVAAILLGILGICYNRYHKIPKSFRRK